MSAEHNHKPYCCCYLELDQGRCSSCPEHGTLATHPAMQPPGPDCEEAIDGWCKTCSTAEGPVYHPKPAAPYTEQEPGHRDGG